MIKGGWGASQLPRGGKREDPNLQILAEKNQKGVASSLLVPYLVNIPTLST